MPAPTAFLYHSERIDGVEREKPTPRKSHIRIQNRILEIMFGARKLDSSFEPMPELATLLDKGTDFLVPDIVVTRTDADYDNGMLHARDALLAIEILSPGQTIPELFGKCELLHEAGCPVCWVIWGERRRAWIHLADDLREVTELQAATLPAAWWINMEQLFAQLSPNEGH
jgi:Uma2 family endonuclease